MGQSEFSLLTHPQLWGSYILCCLDAKANIYSEEQEGRISETCLALKQNNHKAVPRHAWIILC